MESSKLKMNEDFFHILLREIYSQIKDFVQNKEEFERIILKRTNKFHDGDFFIPSVYVKKRFENKINFHESALKYIEMKKSGDMAIFLNREFVFKRVLGDIMAPKLISFNSPDENKFIIYTLIEDKCYFQRARVLLVAQYLCELCNFFGFQSYFVRSNEEQLNSMLDLPSIRKNTSGLCDNCHQKCTKDDLLSSLKASKYYCEKENILDIKLFIDEKGIKDPLSHNLLLIKEPELKELLNFLSVIMENICLSCVVRNSSLVFVSSQANEFKCTKLCYITRVLMINSPKSMVKQLNVAKVFFSTPSELCTLDEFCEGRISQVEEAFNVKYNLQQCPEWLSNIAKCQLKFDFLSTRPTQYVKLNRGSLNTKSGKFVLYNYARLSTLFQQFERLVSEKVYPELPPFSEINFSLLKDEEEWELLLNYALTFRRTIENSFSDLSDVECLNLKIHAPYQFLINFSRDFSSYYGRIRILRKPNENILQLIQARLYLMKGFQQLYSKGLGLLKITPVTYM